MSVGAFHGPRLFWAFPHSSRIHRYWIRKLENQCLNLQMTLVQLFQEAVYISFYSSLSKSTQIFQCFILFCMTMVRTRTHKHTYTHTDTGAQSHLRFPSLATLLRNLMRRRHAYTLCIYTGPLSICRGQNLDRWLQWSDMKVILTGFEPLSERKSAYLSCFCRRTGAKQIRSAEGADAAQREEEAHGGGKNQRPAKPRREPQGAPLFLMKHFNER